MPTTARIAGYTAAVLLLSLLALGFWLYQNLHPLLRAQAMAYLSQWGVQSLDYEGLQVSSHTTDLSKLTLTGRYQGLAFNAELAGLTAEFDWRGLRNGQLKRLEIERLNLLVENKKTKGSKTKGSDSMNFMESDPLVFDPLVFVSEMLPRRLLAGLPVGSLAVDRFNLEYRAPGLEPLRARGEAMVTGGALLQLTSELAGSGLQVRLEVPETGAELRVRIDMLRAKTAFASIAAELTRQDDHRWRWALSGAADHRPLLARLPQLAAAVGLDISAVERVSSAGASRVTAALTHPDQLPPAPDGPLLRVSDIDIQAEFTSHLEQLIIPDAIENLTAELAGSFSLIDGHPQLEIRPTEVTALVHPQLLALPGQGRRWLRWEGPVPLRWNLDKPLALAPDRLGRWPLRLRDNRLQIGSGDSQLRLERVQFQGLLSRGGTDLELATLTGRLNSRLRRQSLPQLELNLEHAGSLQHSRFTVQLADTAESMSIDLRGDLTTDTGRGRYRLRADSADLAYAASTVQPLLRAFGWIDRAIEVESGRLSLDSELQGDGYRSEQISAASQLTLQGFSGRWDDYSFENLAIDASWTGLERWQTTRPIRFSLGRLNPGFELRDLSGQVHMPRPTPIARPQFQVQTFSATVFGGTIQLPRPVGWSFEAPANRFTLRALDWRLADLVALQQGQEIEALGLLEGELPVEISAGRIIVTDGYLRSVPPGGTIRYVANEAALALAEGSDELSLALDLLSNFEYQVLATEVTLDRRGNLLLGLSLAGRNPGKFEGRPVNFNINLEQNLDPLLQSLRMSDSLVDQIEGRLQ